VKKSNEQMGMILKALVDSENYKQTFGKWVIDGWEQSVEEMGRAKTEQELSKMKAFEGETINE
jgi:hypothetical protein